MAAAAGRGAASGGQGRGGASGLGLGTIGDGGAEAAPPRASRARAGCGAGGGARGSERDGAAAGSAAMARDTDEGGEVGAGKRQSRGGDKAGGGRRRSKVTGVDGCAADGSGGGRQHVRPSTSTSGVARRHLHCQSRPPSRSLHAAARHAGPLLPASRAAAVQGPVPRSLVAPQRRLLQPRPLPRSATGPALRPAAVPRPAQPCPAAPATLGRRRARSRL